MRVPWFILFLAIGLTGWSQQTLYYLDKEAAYRQGLELFDEKNYLAAREKFELIYKQPATAPDHADEVLMQNLEYYIAVCAVETQDKDAEQLLLNYRKNYHETDKRRLVNFYLGKYYYQNKKYSDAEDYLREVKIEDLDNDQLYEYRFIRGYCYFVKKKFTEAKPLFASIKEIKEKYYYPSNYYYAFICFYTKEYNEALKGFLLIEDSKKYAAVVPYYIAQIYYIKKDYPNVIATINKYSGQSGVMYQNEMQLLLGQTYFQQGEYEKALPILETYVGKSSKASKDDIFQLAYCQYKTGAYAKAIENFKQLNLLKEELGQNATYDLADCYLKTGQKDKARSAFESAASMDFNPTIKQNALFNYGKLSFELGNSSEAIQSFETYLDKYPNGEHTNEVNEMLATALVQTKNYEKAYHIIETLRSDNPMIKEAYQKVTYFRAVELYNDKKYDEALALCDKSLLNPFNGDLQALAVYLKGEINYNNGHYDDASQNYQQFSVLATPSVENKGQASKFRADYNVGYCYFKKKDYPDAVLYFHSAISDADNTVDVKGKNTLLPDLYLRYADCEFVTHNYGKAVEAYSKIADNNWNAADYAQYRKGIILGLENKNDAKIDALSTLLSRFPTSNYGDQAYFEIGETYVAEGNNSAGLSAYQSVIAKYPNSALLPKCYVRTAVLDYNMGKKELAIADYKDVIKRYPKSKEENESLEALKDIYVELGRTNEYADFVNNNSDVKISSSTQDSLSYQSADNAWNSGDCVRSVQLYSDYLSRFPTGIFSNDAHWNKSDCEIKAKDFNAALVDLKAVIQNRYNRNYERALLKASGIAYFELKDYATAGDLYKQLYVASTSQTNTYTAMLGMLRTAVLLNNYAETVEFADQLLNSGYAKGSDIQEAYYAKGKAYYAQGNKDFAFAAFNRVTELPVSEKAVEAKYMVAKILNEQGKYQQSMDTCFVIKDKYSSYEYWVVKTFILVADNYYAMDNAFQAKATLESIVQNYEGDKAVLDEARTKLEKLRTDEMNKSRILQPATGDSLIMETDTTSKH